MLRTVNEQFEQYQRPEVNGTLCLLNRIDQLRLLSSLRTAHGRATTLCLCLGERACTGIYFSGGVFFFFFPLEHLRNSAYAERSVFL